MNKEFPDFIETPGAGTLFKTHGIPPERIALPVAFHYTKRGKTLLVFLMLGALAFLALACLIIVEPDGDIPRWYDSWPRIGLVAMSLLGLLITLPSLAHARTGKPVLRLDAHGLRDLRRGRTILFDDVVAVSMIAGKSSALIVYFKVKVGLMKSLRDLWYRIIGRPTVYYVDFNLLGLDDELFFDLLKHILMWHGFEYQGYLKGWRRPSPPPSSTQPPTV